MAKSIKIKKPSKAKNGDWQIFTGPTGTDKNGVRNMEKMAYLEYGVKAHKQPATPVITPAVEATHDKVVDDMQETFNKNPTDFDCYPVLSVSANGSYSVNGYSFTVSGATGFPVFIDCETMDAYSSNGDNMNKYVSLPIKNIRLSAGKNAISGTISIKPRWFDM